MTPADLALLLALAVTGGALLAAGGVHDWRCHVSARRFWGDPERGRRPLPARPRPRPAPADVVTPLADRIELAEARASEARRALDALRLEADRQRRAARLGR